MTKNLTQYELAFGHARGNYGENNLVVLALRHSPAAVDDEVLKLPSAGPKLAASDRIDRCGNTLAAAVVEAGLNSEGCLARTSHIVERNGN
jgi:hypothetical protein